MISRSTNIHAALRNKQRGLILNPFRFGAAGDPFFNDTVLIINAQGADDSTSVIDESFVGRAVSLVASTRIKTDQNFGGVSSLYFPGASSYASCAASADWDFTSGDLTVEAWVRVQGSSTMFILDSRNGGGSGWAFYVSSGNTLVMQGTGGSPNFLESPGSAIVRNTKQHIAWTRSGSTNYLFVDGNIVDTNAATTVADSGLAMQMGRRQNAGDLYFTGHTIIRITKGVARWTSSFTPTMDLFPNF